MTKTSLILGGARSGKTARALALAEQAYERDGLVPVYIATAQAFDSEMEDRIARHREERGTHWSTVEAPLDLCDAIRERTSPRHVLLVDCLTLWLSNITFADRDIAEESQKLVDALRAASGPVVVVSNEVGLSIVPENALARRFRDDQGRLNQTIAAAVDHVEFVAAGLPLVLKG
ncbi:bifunctional adenosylcobinamide kinase/adenosylcobinamide-phosphate guanylyltransferase [Rhodospirillaceae bacterium KN72]|uniref:Bifunctional adenosylcobalamin biosynthesis protein n=1 Tax=Pacificispira spongiicola TaxID=2729598 RepID=A0A7Y0E180_9PROT|nr:bifunctional adenosylcobinamide kinase/adenosylcobinamide-phosphate guanylyltransferase [Pacificispira spongiicola]NMM45326.1 bifunctional adenosylcobinamide kinase/adenosylcobinamide-phosphate guanylyltransferase [Pacificispira spongiicola]